MNAKKIIIDTDPAIGYFARDIDDGLAVLFALKRSELNILGITVSYGNIGQNMAFRSAKKVLKTAGKTNINIYSGAYSERDFKQNSRAAKFILETVNKNPNDITLLCLAPLTNIATAINMDNRIVDRISKIVIMGGVVWQRGHIPPFMNAEFNFWRDAQSAKYVLSKGKNIVLIPLDVTTKIIFGKTEIEKLQNSSNKICRYLADNIYSWYLLNVLAQLGSNIIFHKRKLFSHERSYYGFNPHDLIAAVYLIAPEIFDETTENVEIGTGFFDRGRVKISKNSTYSINICRDIKSDRFWEIFMETFGLY